MSLKQEFLQHIRNIVGERTDGLHEPVFQGNEKIYLQECIDSGYVSSVGEFVDRFETIVRDYVGAGYAIAVANGTTALQLSLIVTGVKPNDEVIVPALSFVATANAVSHAGAIPHFVDVDYRTWGMSPEALTSHLVKIGEWKKGRFLNRATGRPITAVVPMHTLGHPVDMTGILEIAQQYKLRVIEDAAESLGSRVGGRHTGLFGDVGIFSFNGNKTITTGGGGVLVTDNRELAIKIRHLSTTARVGHRFEFIHDQVGYNYRMPNLNAALGVAQMEQLPTFLNKQRILFQRYENEFSKFSGGEMKKENEGTTGNFWLQAFLLDAAHAEIRDQLILACLDSGISVRPLWKPLNSLGPYLDAPSAPTPIAADLYARAICLPSSTSLVETLA